jgi:hypothetical protein
LYRRSIRAFVFLTMQTAAGNVKPRTGKKEPSMSSLSPSRINSTRAYGVALCLGSALALFACGSSTSSSASCVADPASTIVCVTEPQPADTQHAYQGVKALVGMYPTDQCTPGTEVIKLSYDVSQTCFGWRRDTGTMTRDNSATHFQCYRDRVCYTQHTRELTCSTSATDKEVRIDACIKDDAGDIWLKLISGTESCPPAPTGFTCPRSSPGEGTPGTG